MVGISGFEAGALVAGRYRVVERLTRFAVADRAVSGVEFEYWLAVDELRDAEVWLQAAVCESGTADGAQLAGAVAAIRRINHPAVPAVLDFGEIEVPALLAGGAAVEAEAEVEAEADEIADLEVAAVEVEEEEIEDVIALEDTAEDVEIYQDVTRIGYTVLAPVEGESLAVALLRGTLAEAEILLVLAEVAELLEILHETELVHGHLSAYSLVLTESGVLLIDLAVALAVEAASDSELTIAADVYALAWLACVLLVGIEVIETEFGAGFVASESGALALEELSLELVARRRRWAEVSLVERYGISAGLAALLIAGLGEAAARPPVGGLTAAFRGRPVPATALAPAPAAPRHAALGAGAVGAAAAVTGAIFVGAVAEVGGAGGLAGSEMAGFEMTGSEMAESETVAAQEESRRAKAGRAAAAGAGVAAAAFGAGAVIGAESRSAAAASTGTASTASTALATESVGVGAALVGASVGSSSTASESAAAQTAVIPRIAATSAPAAAPAARLAQSGIPGSSSPVRRRRTGATVVFGIGLALILVLVLIWALFGRSKSTVPNAAAGATPTSGLVGAPSGSATSSAAGPVVVLPSAAPSQITAPAAGATISPAQSSTLSPTGQAGRPTAPVSPLATIPGSPSLAVQQMQHLVNQSSSGLAPSTLAQLNSILATLQQEVGANSSTQSESAALTQVINQTGFPAGLGGQLSQLIPYLSNFGGS